MKKSLIALMALSTMVVANSSTLEEAFKNGKFSGDVSVWHESRHINKGDKSQYYENTAYIIGSVGLKYETDYFHGFKFVARARGSAPLWEDDRNFDTGHGKGDSTERIYEDNKMMFSNLYLEYNAYDTVVRVGRQAISSDWMSRVNDAVTIKNTSIQNLTLDAMWVKNSGKVKLNEMMKFRPTNKVNEKDGVYTAGATYKFENGLGLRAYGMYANNMYSALGGKILYDGKINEDVGIGGVIHYAQSDEKRYEDDGSVFESTAYVSYKDTTFTLGYVQSGKEIGWGSMNFSGDKIVQFEEGDVMYERDAKTVYGMLSTSIADLSITGLYGTTSYKLAGDNKSYRQNELSVWLSYPIMKNLKAFVTYDQVFKAQPGYPSLTQVGAGLSYTF